MTKIAPCALLMFAALYPFMATSHAEPAYLIDTHVHVDPQEDVNTGVSAAIDAMTRFRVRHIVLMSPPRPPDRPFRYDVETLLSAKEKNPDRISVAGGGGTLNPTIHETPPGAVTDSAVKKFQAGALDLLAKGAIGFGEIAIHH